MTWFEDLSPLPNEERKTVLHVGWLERDHSYNKGRIREKKKVVETLVRLLEKPWDFVYLLGYHACSLCRQPPKPLRLSHIRTQIFMEIDGSLTLRHKGMQITMGATNVLVPGNQCIYRAPSLIAHYILDHGYAPPEPFCQAILACPPMGSTDYFRALISAAPDSFVAQEVRGIARDAHESDSFMRKHFPGLLGLSEQEISEP